MQRLSIPAFCPAPFAKLMQRCWEEDPKQRITCKDILRDLEKMKEKGELQREYIRCGIMIECHGYRPCITTIDIMLCCVRNSNSISLQVVVLVRWVDASERLQYAVVPPEL